ncbi:acetyl-CoA synthetase-like protein [Massarina eburnea CBS 473.64]|uniref:Acetyl-CoA synthetase-like protein n=1 Tax=Massarina eburnea CBS 473.64 TaxID=1395130 RepID=A0A6A6RLP7_9PLEO|nr:acetyl-CoA synthetase-like protein [Massarina eburnea CBS 473.64]
MCAAVEQQSALPDYIDEAANSVPNDTWAIVPRPSTELDEGWSHLTYADLSRAVNNVAWWIENNIGVAQRQGQTIGYMGANDLRYLIVMAATLKVGYVPLFASPRNSLEGQKVLVEKTECEIFLTTTETQSQVNSIRDAIPNLKVFEAPTVQEVLDDSLSLQHYVSRHSRDVTAHSLILHTSGSTGLPKPIRLTVGGLNSLHEQALLEPEEDYQQVTKVLFADRRPMLTAVPFFHVMGIIFGLRSIVCKGTIVRLPSDRMMSAGLVMDVIEATNPTSGVFPPSILEDISSIDKGIETLAKLERVWFGGAPLANASGDKICKVTQLHTIIGSTEAMFMCTLLPSEPDEWNYFHWSSVSGAVMEPAEDDSCELVLKPKDIRYQAIFHTFPEAQEWRTRDLFQQHPSKPFLWKYTGRRDDVIVLSNGEKFNPILTEKLVDSHPWVKGALVVGQGRFQAGLLIEPEPSKFGTEDLSVLIDRIWPIVEQANREAPAHARIYQTKIAIANPQKPFVRASKGSIIRSQTVALFKDEIEALYADEGYSSDPTQDTDDDAALTTQIHAVFTRALPTFHEGTADDTDIFSLGVDSLDVLSLSNALNKSLRGANITAPTIYNNPTVKKLAEALSQNLANTSGQPSSPLPREEKLDAMVRKYTKDLIRQRRATPASQPPSKHTVVLTGSTGSLGSHILEQLLTNPDIEKVYCMNRSSDAESRQKASFTTHHDPTTDFTKAAFLTTDFSSTHFGLPTAIYSSLLESTTVFIHSAWSVDFNLSLASYEKTHISGTRRAVDFASKATHNPPIIFISSIASVANWRSFIPDNAPLPESLASLFDSALPLPQGYAESKHVAARILAIAAHRVGIRTAVVRAGQLAGSSSVSGAEWNRHEWLPSLIHTSRVLGVLPDELGGLGDVDWLPMDRAAGGVVDVSLHVSASSSSSSASGCAGDEDEDVQVYHLVNPHTTSWDTLTPVIRDFYSSSSTIEIVDFDSWIQALQALPPTKENAEAVPGLKLLAFYEGLRKGSGVGLPALGSRRAELVSRTLREGGPVDERVMRKWLGEWGF